eukprot:CAMPEP_0176443696 /NCGR_PEP_ID=MMETSP0127-20121128/22593_1 /TAXON_ID=938130 /ORGANISM="Platyophrya macrostoma, Strain WH" /LENGTH=102 /DNA_ID=CAMNT_0017829007 /DNA_START=6 /DNA_END=314 /DNA_ORIENTATION=+
MVDFKPEFEDNDRGSDSIVHIRVQQRKNKKYITTIQGVGAEFDYQKILKAFRKNFNCNGTIVEEKDGSKVIQLTGDQRTGCAQFFREEGIADKENIKVHGAM